MSAPEHRAVCVDHAAFPFTSLQMSKTRANKVRTLPTTGWSTMVDMKEE
jgi:hypothetical protein